MPGIMNVDVAGGAFPVCTRRGGIEALFKLGERQAQL